MSTMITDAAAWAIADLVRSDLDRQSCPDAYMRIAVESVVKHLKAAPESGNPVSVSERERFEAWWKGQNYNSGALNSWHGDGYNNVAANAGWAAWQAALAARQPVGQEPKEYIEFLDRQNDSLRRAIHAIMAKVAFLLDEDQFADVDAIALAAGVSPPAQAVDLGQFRDVVADWRDRCCRAADKDTILNTAKADRLLALIDSQGVQA